MRFLLLACLAACAADFDILIRDARVVDGTGNPWFRASVGIKDGRIAAIGPLSGRSAARVIDAAGRIAAPGFVDVHTHVESGILKLPQAENFLRDGVTSIVTGNCGSSAEDLKAFFQALRAARPGLNVASLTGHNSVRRAVMGRANRAATPAELERMAARVDADMQAGALGLSTGLEYVPGTYAPPEEIIALARVAARHGGVYASHMRDEGEQVEAAIAEVLRVGREAAIPVHISHLKQDTRRLWGSAAAMLKLLEDARAGGIDVTADAYPYDAFSTGLSFLLPAWSLADGVNAPRAKVAAETLATLRAKGQPDFSYVRVASLPKRREWEGLTITEINRRLNRTPDQEVETVLDLAALGGSGVFRAMSEDDVRAFLHHPLVAVASDGGVVEPGQGMPHPRSYGTNARALTQYGLPLEAAIRKMTALPARSFGFAARGQLRPGFHADLVLFDPGKVAARSTYLAPHQFSTGFDTVLVNGEVVLDEGKLSGARPGQVILRSQTR